MDQYKKKKKKKQKKKKTLPTMKQLQTSLIRQKKSLT